MTDHDDERAWLNTYLDALPDNIRPDPTDRRFTTAAAAASHQGWTAHQAANVITRRNYADKTNPTLIAIIELERLAQRPPAHIAHQQPTRNASGCIVCAPTQTCPHPVTNKTPPEWVAQRFALIRELMTTPGLTEQQAGDTMRRLIADQHAE